jgi:hypothetical protein
MKKIAGNRNYKLMKKAQGVVNRYVFKVELQSAEDISGTDLDSAANTQ